jgi:hypothetical protein
MSGIISAATALQPHHYYYYKTTTKVPNKRSLLAMPSNQGHLDTALGPSIRMPNRDEECYPKESPHSLMSLKKASTSENQDNPSRPKEFPGFH